MSEATEKRKDVSKTPQLTVVYIPFKTLTTAITSLKQALPTKLDKSAWPTFSGLTQSQTFNAFKFLGLVDNDGYVQPALKELVDETLDSPRFKAILGGILRDKYPKVMALISQHGTPAQFQEIMRGYNVSGTTLERAIRFWTEAAKFVGIEYPKNWRGIRISSSSSKRRKASEGVGSEHGDQSYKETRSIDTTTPKYIKTVALEGGIGTVTLEVSVNPIELSGKNRTWFYELIDKLNEFLPAENE